MYQDYIILSFGKIIIKRINGEKKFLKEINNQLIELTKEELEYVNNIFVNKEKELYYSERLIELVEQNDDIENKYYIYNFLEYLERIIPENSKENFYQNVKTLKVKLNFDSDFNKLSSVNKEVVTTTAGYNTKTNSMIIKPESLKTKWEIAQKTPNPNDFFVKEVNVVVLHELAHMASSHYDNTNKISLCGFDKFPPESEMDENRGLTEGMTDVIAMAGIPGTIEIASGYYIEASFINQLIQIVGLEVINDSYFSNKGTIEIENKLNEIINDKNISTNLFRSIEDNYYLKNIDCKQNLLTNIQLTLINYFKQKILKDINNNRVIEEINESIYIFECMLITKEKLMQMRKNPENYIDLDQVSNKFEELKQHISNITKQITR